MPTSDDAASEPAREPELPLPDRAAIVRRFAARCLPSRGWNAVLVVGDAVEDALFLAQRGYDVTLAAERSHVDEDRVTALGLGVELRVVGSIDAAACRRYDAIVCGPEVAPLEREALRRLRRGGVVLFAPGGSGLAIDDSFGGAAGSVRRRRGLVARLRRR